MKKINKKIKEIYISKALFSESIGINPKDLASKLKTVETKINWLNEFLKPLNLKICIKSIKK